MARLSRHTVPQPQHVIQRGNTRSAIFGAEQDYRFYRDCLSTAATPQQCAIHASVSLTLFITIYIL